MGMKVTSNSASAALRKLDMVQMAVFKAVESVLTDAGEYVTEKIRNGEMSEWIHHTYNLVSSIGYGVCIRGELVSMSDFEVVETGSEGAMKGRALVHRLASEHTNADFALFVVAGEEYAVFVEAIESKVVLSSAYLYLVRNIPAKLRDRIKTVISTYEDGR
jgi:hypothetical protein